MGKRLRVPAALAVATLGTAATIALATTSCGGDDAPPKDAAGCAVYCVEAFVGDAGPPDGGCPNCAEQQNGIYVCPSGCTPFG
jgi:hypothetical protein